MTGINHAVTGALVAAAFNKPLISIPAALLSHFAADAIPHWNYQVPGGLRLKHTVMASDLLLSLGLLSILAATVSATPWLVFAGGLFGILPDTMWWRYFLTGKPSIVGSPKRLIYRIRQFHFWIQWSESSWGFFVELAWLPLMVWLIYQISY